mgnify:CR=1 FL=1
MDQMQENSQSNSKDDSLDHGEVETENPILVGGDETETHQIMPTSPYFEGVL